MTVSIEFPFQGVRFVSLVPPDELASLIPVDMMVEWLSGKVSARLKTSPVHVLVIVGVHRDSYVRFARTATGTNEERLVLHGAVSQLYPLRAA